MPMFPIYSELCAVTAISKVNLGLTPYITVVIQFEQRQRSRSLNYRFLYVGGRYVQIGNGGGLELRPTSLVISFFPGV